MPLTPLEGAGAPVAPGQRARRTLAILGPTNTGKTHYAIERMLAHRSGVIGLPLRLLAREVYNRIVEKVGASQVALVTGEEKIKPPQPRYWVATVEAMPRDLDVDFVAVDEIQLGADLDRGHVFTDRILNRRGREETLLIGAATARPLVEKLLPGVTVTTRPRLSTLMYAGERKLSRLPPRSAIVAFSADEVYAIAELMRRQRGGAAVVLGALSPRTRNAQVALFQNGDVDAIVATDAIGMGLNLDVDHIAFAGDRKFDGWQYRRLNPAEIGQIAGRAGRHLRDGTFGVTGRCPPFEEEIVEQVEEHRFDPLLALQWRNSALDFSSIAALQASLEREPAEAGLTRAPLAEDVMVLDIAARDPAVQRHAKTRADVARLWEVCQVPDYRKVSPAAHADLVLTLFGYIVRAGRIPDDWFARQLAQIDRADGDIDTLSARIAHARTFNFIANRPDWLNDPEHWQGITRRVEDTLSDALHERLAHRFVDRRTSVLMRRLRENAMLEAEITATGDVLVEGQHVGQLHGFRFTPDPSAEGEAQRTLNAAALKALASEFESRAKRVSDAVDDAFALAIDGSIRWLGEVVGKIGPGDHLLRPLVRVLADEQLTGAALEMVQKRLDLWLAQHVKKLLGPLEALESGEGLEGIARGVAFQVAEALGVLDRSRVANEIKSLDQGARAALRKAGVRFGAYHVYAPQLLKPAPRALAAQLWAIKHGGIETVRGLSDVAHLAASGRTSFPADKDTPRALYLVAGFRVSGERAVRVDILERLADLIRPAIAYRPGQTPGTPPPGAADGDGFVETVAMTSLVGCSGEAFHSILASLGYVSGERKGPAITVPLLPAAPTEPVKPVEPAASGDEAAVATQGDGAPDAPADAQADAAGSPVAETPADGAAEPAPAEAPVVAPASDATPPAEAQNSVQSSVDESVAAAPEPVAGAPTQGAAKPAADVAAETPAANSEAQAETAVGAQPATPAEEPTILVWRPRGRHHHGPRQDRDHRGPRRGGDRGGRHGRPDQRPDQRAGGEGAAAAPAGEGGVARPAPDGGRGPRPERREGGGFRHRPQGDRPQGDRPRGDRPHGDRPQGDRPHGDRPKGDRPFGERGPREGGRDHKGGGFKGGDRGRDRRDAPGGGNLRQVASTEQKRGREPDPNSPFAKLAALKAAMENKDGGR